jgi:hypothetical protein
MNDATREWLKAFFAADQNSTATVRGSGISVQCAGCCGWFNDLTLFRDVGFLCVECAEGFRSIATRRNTRNGAPNVSD